jgi:hypothetical protein
VPIYKRVPVSGLPWEVIPRHDFIGFCDHTGMLDINTHRTFASNGVQCQAIGVGHIEMEANIQGRSQCGFAMAAITKHEPGGFGPQVVAQNNPQ